MLLICLGTALLNPAFGACHYTLHAPQGWSLLANPCANPNTIGDLMPDAPLGTLVLTLEQLSPPSTECGRWVLNVRATEYPPGWWNSSQALLPGEGFFLFNPGSNVLDLEFSGTNTPPVLPLPWTNCCFLAGRQVDAAGGFEGITGYAPREGTRVYELSFAGYNAYTYSMGLWEPNDPNMAVGVGTFICLGDAPIPTQPSQCSYFLDIMPGWNLIANQCSNNNRVATLIPGAPDETEVWKYDNATGLWSPNQFFSATGWTDPDQTLAPAEGAYVRNPTDEPFRVLFGGWANTENLPLPWCTKEGCFLVSRQVPEPAHFINIMGCDPREETQVFRFNAPLQMWLNYNYSLGVWTPEEPVVGVGESAWICQPGGEVPSPGCRVTLTHNSTASPPTVTITWNCTGCHLEETTSLFPPSWTTVPGTSTPGVTSVTLTVTGSSRFFRLVCP